MPGRRSAWAVTTITAAVAAVGAGAFVVAHAGDASQPAASPADPAPRAVVREAAGPVIWHAWRRNGSVVFATRSPDAVWVAGDGTPRRISQFAPTYCLPALSSGDGVVAFSLGSAVGFFDLDTEAFMRVETAGPALSLAWRPGYRQLAYTVGNAIYVLAADASEHRLLRRVTRFRSDWWERWAPCLRVDGLRWSGNGRAVGYVAWAAFEEEKDRWFLSPRVVLLDVGSQRVVESMDGYCKGDDVFAISPDGGHHTIGGDWGDDNPSVLIDRQRVADTGICGGWPHTCWSPDGSVVVWECWTHVSPQGYRRSLHSFEGVPGTRPNPAPDGWPEFEWSPDGQAFVYHYREYKETAEPELAVSEVRLVRASDVTKCRAVRADGGRSWVRTWLFEWDSVPYYVLAREFKGADLAWSPDGKTVSWAEGRQIWAVTVGASAAP